MISGTMVTSGLSWWQSWICVWVGYFVAAAFVCMTGRIGAVYHIGFPVVNRASFGIWGSLWPVFNRAAMGELLLRARTRRPRVVQTVILTTPACIWYGVQAYIGGNCVYLMIRSIWKSWVCPPRPVCLSAPFPPG